MSDETLRRMKDLVAKSSDGVSWFEDFYAAANGDSRQIPWADRGPNPNLVSWLERERPRSRGADGRVVRALVVGCGLGEDAELLSRWGFEVTAFDISPTAIEWVKQRFPSTNVNYVQADLFNPPAEWIGGWGFVFEAYTVQPLPMSLREAALDAVARLVAPGGQLLFVTRARDPEDELAGSPPWPLTHADLQRLSEVGGLRATSFEDYLDGESPPVRRFRALYTRD